MAIIMKAAPVVEEKLGDLTHRVHQLKKKNITPLMKVFLVGNDPASLLYTRKKKRFCEQFHAECHIESMPSSISLEDFHKQIKEAGEDPSVHGCFVQLPLPNSLSQKDFTHLIPPQKDVDGLGADNFHELIKGGRTGLLPCTPKGIITLLSHYKIPLKGQKIAVIGRSMIVGKPMALLLTNHDATVVLCHGRTKNLSHITQSSDIVIVAVGKPGFIDSSHLDKDKKTIVVDVGINHDSHGNLCGDVNYQDVLPFVGGITPVPGGVGPMTVLSLGENLLSAAEKTVPRGNLG